MLDKAKLLEDRLKIYGLKEKTKIAGDGNCQFAAVADQLYGDISYAPKIRLVVICSYLRKKDRVR